MTGEGKYDLFKICDALKITAHESLWHLFKLLFFGLLSFSLVLSAKTLFLGFRKNLP